VERARNIGSICLADLRQFHGTTVAVEQFHAEIGLKLLDLTANRAGREAQFICRIGEMQPPRGGVKSTQGRKGRDTSRHARQIIDEKSMISAENSFVTLFFGVQDGRESLRRSP
jgi:hypothetical protein